MTQTYAILLDAYRELNAKKLFWIVLALSGLVVVVFALIGNNDRGITFLHWTFDFEFVSTKFIPQDQFYKIIFVNFGLAFWLTWIATALALVSTASIFPDFLAGGAIELALSKPIGRLRLFLTKYAAGLLFVLLQVGVFTLASFLVIGLRGGSWEPRILLAIPIVVLVFSYLYSVLVLVGVLWRSTIAALLVTLLVWFMIFLVNAADTTLLAIRTQTQLRVEAQGRQADELRTKVKELEARAAAPSGEAQAEPEPAAPAERPTEGGLFAGLKHGLKQAADEAQKQADPAAELSAAKNKLASREKRLAEISSTRDSLVKWHNITVGIKTTLPKTAETTALMERYVVDKSGLKQLRAESSSRREHNEQMPIDFGDPDAPPMPNENVMAERIEQQLESRTEWWIIGTSLGFECVMIALGAWIFCRREF